MNMFKKLLLLIASLFAILNGHGAQACSCATLASSTIANTAYGTYSASFSVSGVTFTLSLVYSSSGITGTVSNGAQSCTGSTTSVTTTSTSLTATISIDSGTNTLGCGTSATAVVTFNGSEFSVTYTATPTGYTGTVTGDCTAACAATSSPTVSPGGTPAPSAAPVASAPTGGVSIPCFSGDTTCMVKGRGQVAMEDLQVGDLVLDTTGNYQPIYTFGHHKADQESEFIQLHTANSSSNNGGKPLEISKEHLIFLAGEETPVTAGNVKVGDALQGIDGQEQPVTKITYTTKEGIYAPFTQSGSLMVNGHAVSSYVTTEDMGFVGFLQTMTHEQIHTVLTPLRVFCMGAVSSNVCNYYNEEGMPYIISEMRDAALWVNSQSMIIQFPVAMAFAALLAVCLALEAVFGAPLAPLGGAVAVGGAYYLRRHLGSSKKIKSV